MTSFNLGKEDWIARIPHSDDCLIEVACLLTAKFCRIMSPPSTSLSAIKKSCADFMRNGKFAEEKAAFEVYTSHTRSAGNDAISGTVTRFAYDAPCFGQQHA